MRRAWGAAIIFLVIAIPRLVVMYRIDPLVFRLDRPVHGPPPPVGPVPASVPPAFVADPLRYLSIARPDSLALLPGIGPVLAARIAQTRSGKSMFISWDELQRVHGIGPKTVERLKAAAGADR